MANTINNYPGNGASSVATSRSTQSTRGNASAATTENTPSGSENAEVQITGTASRLASLGQHLSSLPAINQSRVAQISQALANGTYSISSDKIASGLLQSDHGLAQIGL
jgi:negative regulator of flagellin synthesis FlgM